MINRFKTDFFNNLYVHNIIIVFIVFNIFSLKYNKMKIKFF